MSSKYEIPLEVEYCKVCGMSNQKPNTSVEYKNSSTGRSYIGFKDGICNGCRYHEIKKNIDWDRREQMLLELLDKHRKNDGSYDVIVPSSGGKDSFFAAHLLKYKYNMNPLTVTWAPHMYTDVGRENLENMINNGGFDNILWTPNGKVHRKLARLAFENMLFPFQPFVLGQKNIGPRHSILYDVPLVMYGESNVEYGDEGSEMDFEMVQDYYSSSDDLKEIYISGVSAYDLIDKYSFSKNDLNPYLPVDKQLLIEKKTSVHHLGHYIKWDPQEVYYYTKENSKFKTAPERSEGTYTKYSEIDDKFIPLNFYTMHVKFGIGRAMYDASKEARNGQITREEAVALINKFDGEYPKKWLKEILEYLNLTQEGFDSVCDSFRPEHLWELVNGSWKLRHPAI